MSLYDVLGISKLDSAAQIKAAFRKLAQKLHPDKDGGDKEKFQAIQQAYDVLSDGEKRAHYDATGTIGVQGPTLREEALLMLSKLANQVIDNFDPDNTNILARIRDKLDGGITELNGINKEMEKKAAKVRRAMSKLKAVDGKEDSICQILAAIEKNCTEPMKQIKQQIEVVKIAIEILKDHKYDFVDEPKKGATYFTTFMTQTRIY